MSSAIYFILFYFILFYFFRQQKKKGTKKKKKKKKKKKTLKMQRLFLLSLLIATCYGASISVCGPNCDGCQEVASLDVNNCKDYSREGAATGSIKLTSCSEEDGVGKFEVFTTKKL